MEDDFDYREILQELDDMDKLLDDIQNQFEDKHTNSWTLVLKNEKFVMFQNYSGETRHISANYINNLFDW